ncbi:hypothetical protein NA643_15325 [Pseudomonas stutzeri]|uniref:hypothetical protein n=1 Tax=Stutzerimonas stutzeri TaxID=316 RepID=UPI000C9CACB4|nr:hypothetical protein [Stutzerimonas stutzeri]MCQ4280464.1 hypothetical protein [Stutzerimonas stutzeri]PNF71507.1 hypothetical protein CXK96_16850 [Stutzerimonas stutzeri]
MEKHTQYTSLEWACRALKAENPALLSQLAKQMVSIIDPDCVFNPETIRVIDPSRPEADLPITYGDLSSYLDAATGRYVPVLFETSRFTMESQHVRVNVEWLGRQASRARESLGLIELVQAPVVNEVVSLAYRQNASVPEPIEQPPQMTADGLDHLHSLLAFKNDQRRAQEAAGKEAIARQATEAKVLELQALLVSKEAENRILRQQLEEASDVKSDLRRGLADLQQDVEYLNAQIDNVAGLVAFMNPTNPLSPPVGREAVMFWCEATSNGQIDPTKATGRGVGPQTEDWWKKRHGTPPSLNVKQALKTVCTPACRKKGGLVSKT